MAPIAAIDFGVACLVLFFCRLKLRVSNPVLFRYVSFILQPRDPINLGGNKRRWTCFYLTFTTRQQECFQKSLLAHELVDIWLLVFRFNPKPKNSPSKQIDRFQRAAHQRDTPLRSQPEKLSVELAQPDPGTVQIWFTWSCLCIALRNHKKTMN